MLSNMAIKASIGIQLLRLAIQPRYRNTIYAVLVVTELYSFAYFFIFVFQCSPSSYFWTRLSGSSGTCLNPHVTINATYAYSAITCVGDWTFAILPCFLVWGLQMDTQKKIYLIIILSMGAM